MDTATIKAALPALTVFELVDIASAIDDELTQRESDYEVLTMMGLDYFDE